MAIGALILSAVCALIYLEGFLAKSPSVLRSVFKTAPVALLAGLAWLDLPWFLALGLTLGALGDLALSRDGERAFLAGLVSFALAHLAYVAQFLSQQGGVDPVVMPVNTVPVTIGIVLFAGGMAWKLWPATGALRMPVMGYIAIIAAMGFSAMPLGWQFLAPAMIFMVSDAILATELFLMRKDHSLRVMASRMVWITYYAAQLLFVITYLVPVIG